MAEKNNGDPSVDAYSCDPRALIGCEIFIFVLFPNIEFCLVTKKLYERGIYASFGGLQLWLNGDPIHCTKFKVDQKLFLLIRNLP
ncbi:hypothetical protein FEM48_Zijuj07G0162000 [Ziziphus jujuba var. spinosa]|uniref:Uncharacterized protein n=1 Tax=Ziziphus jujuba var. spinosa TaxID=714518 RepID=A0A978V5M4_ZIZJJ|nr:hypothetical protein FEM48_Zijuj07G0162000 [Ziziphus jujuba var. spinosa]